MEASMTNNLGRMFGRVAVGAAALALLSGLAAEARASVYSYAYQSLDNFTFTGATIGDLTFGTNNSAIVQGGNTPAPNSTATIGILDAPQAYVGNPPAPAQNTFFPGAGPVNADYARGDSLITQAPFSTTNVAEGFLNTIGSMAAATGTWNVSAPITLAASGAVTLSFDFENLLRVVNTGPIGSTGSAAYSFTFTIRNDAGVVVFSASPDAVNKTISLTSLGTVQLPPSGVPATGSVTITSGTLDAGNYTASITGTENVFLTVVPEPSTLALTGVPVALGLVLAGWRRRRLLRALA
jgi:hypothetical protein